MEITETILACGHENIQAKHKTTLEITKENKLSKRGDCIIAVSASKAITDLNSEFKKILRREDARVTVLIEVEGIKEVIQAFGSPKLILTHPRDIVIRKSNYICNRTLAIHADKAAYDLSRSFVRKLQNPRQTINITLTVTI
jgi:hypothetical protein